MMGSPQIGMSMQGTRVYNTDGGDGIDIEFWRACAGPLATIPGVGKKVFYFPQGHIEQVEAYVNQESNRQALVRGLPSKILCRVVNVQLKAEQGTDEVFAQVTLIPEAEDDSSDEKEPMQTLTPRSCVYSFCKILTPSDTSTHGGFSVLKKHADECLPPLNMSNKPPAQELKAKDLHGVEWKFRHIYRGQPKRHLFTTGWSIFVNAKKLVARDAFIFLSDKNGEHRVGVRRAIRQQSNASASVISGQSMQLGVLASASHAITTGTMFSVFYWPRKSLSRFIIPYDQYVESMKTNHAMGTRFRMRFEGEDGLEESFTGTVVGTEDAEPETWPNSKWRRLKVQWDEPSTIMRPERVSPWEMVPVSATESNPSFIPLHKKHAPCASFSKELTVSAKDGTLKVPVKASPRISGVFQGQEENMALLLSSFSNYDESESERKISFLLPQSISPQYLHSWNNSELVNPQKQEEFENLAYYLKHKLPDKKHHARISNPSINQNPFQDESHGKRNGSASELPTQNASNGSTFMLFGFNIIGNPVGLVSSCVGSSDELHNALSQTSETPKPSDSISSDSFHGQSSMTSLPTARSCTKVHKKGTVLGRSIDLLRFNGYEELISELDQMFEFEGGLVDRSKGWSIFYTDDKGDILMIGRHSWQEFCSRVRKMYIYPREEVEKFTALLAKPQTLGGAS